MQFVRTDAYDGVSKPALTVYRRLQFKQREERTVLLMQLGDLPCIATTLDNIVVELVPESQCGQLWRRKCGEGTEIQAIDS